MLEIEEKTALGKALLQRLTNAMDDVESIIQDCREAKDHDVAFKGFTTLTRVIESAAKVAGIVKQESVQIEATPHVQISPQQLRVIAGTALAIDEGGSLEGLSALTQTLSLPAPAGDGDEGPA